MPKTNLHSPRFSQEEIDIETTPFVSAPSVTPTGYFFSAPTSPTHSKNNDPVFDSGSFEFEFSSRFSHSNELVSADQLFFNGQIRPIKLSSILQNPQENQFPCHRKTRSMSPFGGIDHWKESGFTNEDTVKESESIETTPSCSASSSRSSSSSGRNSKKWIFLKDLLHRSKSEGRANNSNKDRFWSFAPKIGSPVISPSSSLSIEETKGKEKVSGKPANGLGKRRGTISAHELHYTANRAQAEEMKKKTFLPYRQGLFGCLGLPKIMVLSLDLPKILTRNEPVD